MIESYALGKRGRADAMSDAVIEHGFTCPYCWETISMLLDLSAGDQAYVEDCEVCCNPISVQFRTNGDSVTEFAAEQLP